MQKIMNAGHKLIALMGGRSGHKENPIGKMEQQIQKARIAWLKQMKGLKDDLGVVILPERAPELPARHLKNCRVVPNREVILQHLKKGAVAAEVGVQEGAFSTLILQHCRPEKLHMIDRDLTGYGIGQKFEREIVRKQVMLHESDSSKAIASFPDRYFDFIYIDADHSYEGVTKDIQAACGKIKKDGLLVFNDYTYWSPGECINYGVIQAVNELCIRDNWEMLFFALAGYMYCDVAIRKINV